MKWEVSSKFTTLLQWEEQNQPEYLFQLKSLQNQPYHIKEIFNRDKAARYFQCVVIVWRIVVLSFDGFRLIQIGHNWMNCHALDASEIWKFKDKCRAREVESDCIEKSANMRFGADRATCWPKLNCFHDEGTVAVYLLTCSRVIVSMYYIPFNCVPLKILIQLKIW